MVATRPELLATCEKGTKCREEVVEWMDAEITKQWETAWEVVKQTIEATRLTNIATIETGFDRTVTCGVDFPCCEYSDSFMRNLKTSWKQDNERLKELHTKWTNLDLHRQSLIETCPASDF